MLITFTSKFNPDIVMFGDIAGILLKAMGESGNTPGILRGENIRHAADKLKKYLQDLAQDTAENAEDDDSEPGEKPEGGVNLKQRALPLLEMLDTAYREEGDVIWR